ncbi:malonate decarboxylase acyl carrier protein [Serratia aquatilis]|uniref:Malonate decarboxylase acyl carrier protein n=1 Tax=Serratia aquatilis TaxID=1737515 RepID=A0ABV6EBR7_9GAMM
MEHFNLSYPASITLPGKALAGVVGSGDMEALFESDAGAKLTVAIRTSVDGSKQRWQHLFDRLATLRELPAGRLEINDFGATPGVARLRIEQVFEEAAYA